MIDRREILAEAERLTLLPNVVEKDYVLGWMLAGIYAHPDISGSWVFKGGTCLKKCWFETYRFSEDLDFTLTDAAHLDGTFLKRVFGEVGQWIYDRTGIEIPADKQNFDIYQNPRGTISCEGKISYLGPVSPRSGGWPPVLSSSSTPITCLPIRSGSSAAETSRGISVRNWRSSAWARWLMRVASSL